MNSNETSLFTIHGCGPNKRCQNPLRDISENPRGNVRACAAGDGAVCSKNRKIVPYHQPQYLRSPCLIMAPGIIYRIAQINYSVIKKLFSHQQF